MTDDLRHRVARAWAEIDGRGHAFDEGRKDPVRDLSETGHYNGYLADADVLIELAGLDEYEAAIRRSIKHSEWVNEQLRKMDRLLGDQPDISDASAK